MKRLTEEQKTIICNMRNAGLGYKEIGKRMKLSRETVRSYCQRNAIKPLSDADKYKICRYCGVEVFQKKGVKHRIFCSDSCRQKWWNMHPEMVNRKAIYTFDCAYCHSEFTAYGNKHRKYCSHECYIADRFPTRAI